MVDSETQKNLPQAIPGAGLVIHLLLLKLNYFLHPEIFAYRIRYMGKRISMLFGRGMFRWMIN
jgi:hypothetical protein